MHVDVNWPGISLIYITGIEEASVVIFKSTYVAKSMKSNPITTYFTLHNHQLLSLKSQSILSCPSMNMWTLSKSNLLNLIVHLTILVILTILIQMPIHIIPCDRYSPKTFAVQKNLWWLNWSFWIYCVVEIWVVSMCESKSTIPWLKWPFT